MWNTKKKAWWVQSGAELYRRRNLMFLRGSHEGFIQFPSTPPCWFNLFFGQTSQKGMSASLHSNWPSADLSRFSHSNANNQLKNHKVCTLQCFYFLFLQHERCSTWYAHQALIDFCSARWSNVVQLFQFDGIFALVPICCSFICS